MIFRGIGVRLAELTVPDGPAGVVVRPSAGTGEPAFEVRVAGEPRWRIVVGYGPDDGWRVEPVARGTAAPDPPGRAPDGTLEREYRRWAAGTRAEANPGVLRLLPPGRYLLVRSSLEPRLPPTALLGNEHLPRPPHIAALLDGLDQVALAVGAVADRAPDLTAPLVGVVTLGYANSSSTVVTLLFAGVAREAPEPAPDGDMVFIVPVTGPLVRRLEADAQPVSGAAAAAWASTGARRLAAALTGPFGR